MEYQVLLFYKYVTVPDPEALKAWVLARAEVLSLKGRVIIAEEGINGTLEGLLQNTQQYEYQDECGHGCCLP
jgi:UPF0176 protein